MLRIVTQSLMRSARTCQVKKCAGIFTTASKLQADENGDEAGTGKIQGFEKSLNSVTLLGIFFIRKILICALDYQD
jgi:hypothetical protein